MNGYKVVDYFVTLDLADIAAEGLKREGVDAKTNPNHRVTTHGYAFPAGGVPLYVREEDFNRAKRIIDVKFKNSPGESEG